MSNVGADKHQQMVTDSQQRYRCNYTAIHRRASSEPMTSSARTDRTLSEAVMTSHDAPLCQACCCCSSASPNFNELSQTSACGGVAMATTSDAEQWMNSQDGAPSDKSRDYRTLSAANRLLLQQQNCHSYLSCTGRAVARDVGTVTEADVSVEQGSLAPCLADNEGRHRRLLFCLEPKGHCKAKFIVRFSTTN